VGESSDKSNDTAAGEMLSRRKNFLVHAGLCPLN
jgi:hypothetical protein